MSTSEILDIPELLENQMQAHIIVNEAVAALSAATQGLLEIDMNATADDRELLVEEFTRYFVFDVSNSSGAFNLIVPSTINSAMTRRYLVVQNSTGSTLTVITDAAGTSVDIGAGSSRQLIVYGDDVFVLSNHPTVAEVAVSTFIPNLPNANEEALRLKFPYDVTFAEDFAGSNVSIGTNATAVATFAVRRDGTIMGSIAVQTDGSAIFTTTGGGYELFSAGEVMTIDTPTVQDSTMADVSITLVGERA